MNDLLITRLVAIIESRIDQLVSHASEPEVISELLSDIFIDCDDLILEECRKKSSAVEKIGTGSTKCNSILNRYVLSLDGPSSLHLRFAPFKAGCCALISVIIGSMVYIVHVGDSRAIFCSSDTDVQCSADEKKLSEENALFNRVALKVQKLRSFTRKSDEEISGAVIQSEDMSLSGRMRLQRGYEVGGSNFHFRGHGLSIQVLHDFRYFNYLTFRRV